MRKPRLRVVKGEPCSRDETDPDVMCFTQGGVCEGQGVIRTTEPIGLRGVSGGEETPAAPSIHLLAQLVFITDLL